MKKLFRIIIVTVFFPIWYPINAFAVSLFFIVPLLGVISFSEHSFLYFLGAENKKEHHLEELKESFLMGTSFIWYPLLEAKRFINLE